MKQKCGKYCVVLTTCASREDAGRLARILLEKRLAACVQVMPVSSFFDWKDEICEKNEFLLFIKSRKNLYGELEAVLSEHHPYEVPEIVRLPVQAGFPAYLGWMDSVLQEVEEPPDEKKD